MRPRSTARCQLWCPAPVNDVLDDIRREQAQAQYPTNVGVADPFSFSQLSHGREPAVVQHSLPSPCARERLDQRGVWLRFGAGHDRAPVRCDDALVPASTLEEGGIDEVPRRGLLISLWSRARVRIAPGEEWTGG
jgi:hypothetical protein